MRDLVVLCVAALGVVASVSAKDKGPTGLIAASVGEQVVLADPASGWSQAFLTGTVGWLYPAPGGVLFAPDLVHGRTTVFDLRARTVHETLSGVTMPFFGDQNDRYLVVAGGEVMIVSYPDRAPLASFAAEIAHPWQLVLTAEESSLLVLDRHPEGGNTSLVGADLSSRQVTYRRRLEGDVVRMALSPILSVLAVADAQGDRVCLIEPATGAPLSCWPTPGSPRDLVFTGDPEQLVVAVATPAGAGTLLLWRLKSRSAGLEVKAREVSLGGAPLRLAPDPTRRFLAVGLATGRLEVVDLGHRVSVSTVALPGEPRDVVWCDPSRPGPLLPEWSDRGPRQLQLDQAPIPTPPR